MLRFSRVFKAVQVKGVHHKYKISFSSSSEQVCTFFGDAP